MTINFKPPEIRELKPRILVLGVGGAGGNAINGMIESGLQGVEFIAVNTDAQDLKHSQATQKIQIGLNLTKGLGTGAKIDIGQAAADESLNDIINTLQGANMVFITAGMGGGTGTGSAHVIARAAKELNILTVGVVTLPFLYEGPSRMRRATQGLEELRKHVDTLLVINNQKLLEVHGDLTLSKAFSKANEVLNIATKGIAEVITQHLTVNIDLSDARLVLQKSGTAIMGQAEAEGENRAVEAVKNALDSPLLNDNDIYGSKHVLLKIVTGDSEEDEISMNELKLITDTIQKEAGNNVNIINGVGTDSELGSKLSVTVIATGFEAKEEQKEVVVGIGEDETLDTISLDTKRKEEILENVPEDFSQQSMFDFEDNIDISFSETEDTVENTEEDENNLIEFTVSESVEEETTETKEEEEN